MADILKRIKRAILTGDYLGSATLARQCQANMFLGNKLCRIVKIGKRAFG